jgi:hypothetical protein
VREQQPGIAALGTMQRVRRFEGEPVVPGKTLNPAFDLVRLGP